MASPTNIQLLERKWLDGTLSRSDWSIIVNAIKDVSKGIGYDGGSIPGSGGGADSITTTSNISDNITLDGTSLGKLFLLSGTSADYTVGLPTAIGNAGKQIAFTGTSTLTKIVTIDANGTETINGLLVRLISSGGSFVLISDGANWHVVNEVASIIPFIPTPVGVSALTGPTCWYSLSGKRLTVNYNTGASTSSGTTFTLSIPSGMVSNSNAETLARVQNNSGILPGPGIAQINIGTSSFLCYTSPGGAAWAATGTKFINFQLTIEIQ